jgi:ABC-2 type transport system ATP-binding protein
VTSPEGGDGGRRTADGGEGGAFGPPSGVCRPASIAPIIETEGLTRRFGTFCAVDRLTLRVPRARIFGFLGPNGSGKTTTLRMLCGLLLPTAGEARVNGCDIVREAATLRQTVGYMSQRFALYPDLTVRENLEFYAGAYGISRSSRGARIERLLDPLELGAHLDQLAGSLALGWKQRVALGAALLHEPLLLFLDEPTSGVDPDSRSLLWEFLEELASKSVSIFVTTHAMEDADRCHEVGIMYQSRLIACGSPTALAAGAAEQDGSAPTLSMEGVFVRLIERAHRAAAGGGE